MNRLDVEVHVFLIRRYLASRSGLFIRKMKTCRCFSDKCIFLPRAGLGVLASNHIPFAHVGEVVL